MQNFGNFNKQADVSIHDVLRLRDKNKLSVFKHSKLAATPFSLSGPQLFNWGKTLAGKGVQRLLCVRRLILRPILMDVNVAKCCEQFY